jgi:activator of HSP90 ATPase
MIPGYELAIKVSWEGEVRDGEGAAVAQARGGLEIPYLADENADEDPEIKVTVAEGSGSAGARLRDAVVSKGRPLVAEALRTFVKEFGAGGPAKDEVKGVVSAAASAKPAASGSDASVSGASSSGGQKKAAEQKGSKAGTKTVKMTQKFYCKARDVYEALLDEKRVRAFTQSAASIAPEKGRAFSLFDGAVTGIVQELVPNELIVQKWRFSNWEDGVYSTVRRVAWAGV